MATCPDNFAHMADDLEQNMILNGENDLDLFGFCSMIVDDNENGEELERRMGESESDSPMSLGASFTSSENSPSLKANSLDEDISPFFPPGGFSELNKSLSKPEISSMGMKPGEGHQVTDNGQQDISAIPMSQDQRKVCKRMKEYEMNRVKVKNPVHIHGPNSVIVDHGFIKYELEIPNNPDYNNSDIQVESTVCSQLPFSHLVKNSFKMS